MDTKGTVLSGMRPTGRLQLGNLIGALSSWVRLQETHTCYFAVVDWHALTTGYDATGDLLANVREMLLDWLSAGIDPTQSVVFRQSDVKEHAELHLLLSMITPLSWLERCPTYKEQLRQLEGRELATHGFLGYPILQAADIFMYKADTVPVGEDQLPHLELAREIARRFNHLYGPVFPEPQPVLTQVPLLPGIDGRKMSKSYGNQIDMAEAPESLQEKISRMITDPARVRRNDPGHPEVCAVYAFHRVYSEAALDDIATACREAAIGCVECKRNLAQAVIQELAPIHARRQELAQRPDDLGHILEDGARRAREAAARTMEDVRRHMRLA